MVGMKLKGSGEICIPVSKYLYFSASRFLARVHIVTGNLLCISKHSDLISKVQNAMDENDAQNVLYFKAPDFFRSPRRDLFPYFRPTTPSDDFFTVSGLAFHGCRCKCWGFEITKSVISCNLHLLM